MKSLEKMGAVCVGDALSRLTAAAQEVSDSIQRCDAELDALYAERELLKDGPGSKADYLRHVAKEIARKGDGFKLAMVKSVDRSAKSFRAMSGPAVMLPGSRNDRRFSSFFVSPSDAFHFEEMLCFYFGDLMIQQIDSALDAVTWSEDAMPEKDRPGRIADIDKEIAAIQARRDEIAQAFESAGIFG